MQVDRNNQEIQKIWIRKGFILAHAKLRKNQVFIIGWEETM